MLGMGGIGYEEFSNEDYKRQLDTQDAAWEHYVEHYEAEDGEDTSWMKDHYPSKKMEEEPMYLADLNEMDAKHPGWCDPPSFQFLLIYHFPDDTHSIEVADEATVSRMHDLEDCYDGRVEVFCLVDGKLEPVTLGHKVFDSDEDNTGPYYASSPMIAAGKVVGYVSWTDH